MQGVFGYARRGGGGKGCRCWLDATIPAVSASLHKAFTVLRVLGITYCEVLERPHINIEAVHGVLRCWQPLGGPHQSLKACSIDGELG